MNRLYMIRLENGDSAVLQAPTEEEAIRRAGLTMNPAQVAAEFGDRNVALTHRAMVDAGVGPQNFRVRELQSFMCMAVLREDGNFDFRLDSDPALDEFYLDYPHIDAAAEENSRMDPKEASFDNPAVQELFRDAVDCERTRFLVAPY